MSGTTKTAIDLVHGLATIHRWTGDESIHRSEFKVPAIIVSYNLFMNSVDLVDQMVKTNHINRREKRISMNIFTFLWA